MPDAPPGPSSRTLGARGPYAKTAERREEILAASTEVFAASGVSAGSMREVAARVGISLGGLLHHFPTKEALLAAVLDRRDEESAQALGDADGLDVLYALVALARAQARRQPGLIRLHTVVSAEAAAPDHLAHAYAVRHYADVLGTVTRALVLARERGQVRADVDATRAARAFVALWDGLQVQWLLDPVVDVAAEMDAYVRGLLTASTS